MAKLYHPDKASVAEKDAANARFQEIAGGPWVDERDEMRC